MAFIEEAKLVYGVVFSLRNYMQKISKNPSADSFSSFSTSNYKLVFFQTATNLKFIMSCSINLDTSYVLKILKEIYVNLYLEFVVKNPLIKLNVKPEIVDKKNKNKIVDNANCNYITSELFNSNLQKFIKSVAGFE
ncbi:TRAPP subunit bet5 [Clydaea vesicula]|uniref:Trafficking protein particle complex subunit n=1 Tax=Clydaea vesicula TaxID=447962 RepID=A0AAD5U959_9FUNG|nr:TRAPP subunit bet5 [Clydaea vesicula]KAJ3392976.1 TRAPP subunit bet5 [Lobulomyces angularis]